ncbi:MAG: hypothetical protein AAGA68_26180 [Pseudomonadota bacterium]
MTDEDARSEDSTSTKVYGSVLGNVTDHISVYGFASYEDVNGIRRAQGDLLTGRSQFAEDVSLLGKIRVALTDEQSLTVLVNDTELTPTSGLFDLASVPAGDGTQTDAKLLVAAVQSRLER